MNYNFKIDQIRSLLNQLLGEEISMSKFVETLNDQYPNCLSYALRFWNDNPDYHIAYNSDHAINIHKAMPLPSGYSTAHRYGYEYFASAFEGLITAKDKLLLKKYFEL